MKPFNLLSLQLMIFVQLGEESSYWLVLESVEPASDKGACLEEEIARENSYSY